MSSHCVGDLCPRERLREIGPQVVVVFDPDREPDQPLGDSRLGPVFGTELDVGGVSGE